MIQFRPATILAPALLLGAAFLLSACGSMTTYGTGTTAAKQTLNDVTGILSFGSGKQGENIEYEPRPPIVEPPAAALPPPGSEADTAVAANSNWPVDPELEQERVQALVKEAQESGQSLKFTVPETQKQEEDSRNPWARNSDDRDQMAQNLFRAKMNGYEDAQASQKMFADAKQAKVGSFDENGNPVRQYLIEPPSAYRTPDPESPVEITEKPKKKDGLKLPDLWPF
jgi:hypothetical protein